MSFCLCVWPGVCVHLSLTVCEILPWPLALPCRSPLTHTSCQHGLPQGTASLLFPPSGFPRVRLPAQSPPPVASGAGLTLTAIHSGKPPICSFSGHAPREVAEEERDRAEKGWGAVGSTHPSFWKESLPSGPVPGPIFLPHALIQSKYLGSWPLCLGMGMNSPLQIQQDLLGI